MWGVEIETYLTGARLGVLFLDLHLDHVARMLNDFRNKRLVSPSNLPRDAFAKIRKSTQHPVLPENANAVAEGLKVGPDHTEGSVDGPEDKKYNEQVVGVPESLKVGPSRLLHGGKHDSHERNQHNVSAPSGPRQQIRANEAFEPELLPGGKSGQVIPVRNGVDPGEEDNGPSDEFVEGDVLVERDDAV